jgi:hypothetical protein
MSWTRNSQIKNALLNKSKFTKYGAGFLCFLFLPGSICANASVFFLWVLCSFLTISVYDAKIRQIPPIAKNHPTVTCKNLLTKPLLFVKRRKWYFPALQTIFFRTGTHILAVCIGGWARSVTLLRCYSYRKGYSYTKIHPYIYIYYNIYKYKYHFWLSFHLFWNCNTATLQHIVCHSAELRVLPNNV